MKLFTVSPVSHSLVCSSSNCDYQDSYVPTFWNAAPPTVELQCRLCATPSGGNQAARVATISGVRGVTALMSTDSWFFRSPRLYMLMVMIMTLMLMMRLMRWCCCVLRQTCGVVACCCGLDHSCVFVCECFMRPLDFCGTCGLLCCGRWVNVFVVPVIRIGATGLAGFMLRSRFVGAAALTETQARIVGFFYGL